LASRFIAQARKAGEQAAAAAHELSDLTAAKMGALKEAGISTLVEALADFNAALPAASEAGYALKGLNVALALPPQVTATFAAADDISPANVERVLTNHADRRFTVALIKSLYQAWQVQMKVQIGGLKPSSLSVIIGLSPSVSVNFA
jgi:hypothetical protein